MSFQAKAVIMNGKEMGRAIKRMAHEIIEAHKGIDNLVLLGIQRRGVPLARLIGEAIKQVEGVDLPRGAVDITFYRDDLSTLGPSPKVSRTELHFDVSSRQLRERVPSVWTKKERVPLAISALMLSMISNIDSGLSWSK